MDPNARTFDLGSDKYRLARPTYPVGLYEALAGLCPGRVRAWDCGCGNGQVASDLVSHLDRIEATDISENQIQNAHQDPRIRYSVQRSEATDFPADHFDLVCAAQCLHWFDLPAFFAEVGRVLKPGGVFACWGYGFFSVDPAVDALLRDRLLDPIAPYWSPRSKLLHDGYREVEFPFEKIRLPELEMVVSWTGEQLLEYLSTWSAVKRLDEINGTSILDAVRRELPRHWAPGTAKDVRMDFFAYARRKHGGPVPTGETDSIRSYRGFMDREGDLEGMRMDG